jgi:hypothetical protein
MGQQQYDNTNRFTLFPNKNKQADNPEHDRKPHYTGKININGVDHWLNGWLKTAQTTGVKYLSGTLGDPCDAPRGGQNQPARTQQRPAQGQQQQPPADPRSGPAFGQDDIPF